MPWSAEFQFRAAQYGFGAASLDTGEAVSANKNCDEGRGAARASVYADGEGRETCSVLERCRAGCTLMAEVGWIEYPQAGLDLGTQNCVANHKN
jgi:hypothetical protein